MATGSLLQISWQDSNWIPILTQDNVLDYFMQRSNPFYDRTCNNEVIKMQRLDVSRLTSMKGVEYNLIHVQDPILFIIRKQYRSSPTDVTPLAAYYILAGVVYQAPDLSSVLNSRILSALHHIQSAYNEALSYSRYEASKGYYWEFHKKPKSEGSRHKSDLTNQQELASTIFQRKKVDVILTEFSKKFPQKYVKPSLGGQPINVANSADTSTQSKNQIKGGVSDNGVQKDSHDAKVSNQGTKMPADNSEVLSIPSKKRKV